MKTLKTFVKSKLLSTAGNFASDENGNMAVIGALTIALMVGALAISIDMSNAISAKQRLQDTTDAIALMAARSEVESQADLNAIAQEYFEMTYPGESGADINLDSITRDGAAVTVLASNTQETYFSGIFGKNGLDVSVASTAIYASRNLNLALVLDSTGSMSNLTPTGGTRLDSLKGAGINLIDQLSNSVGEVNVSVVPFAAYVTVDTNLSGEKWLDTGNASNDWNGCMGSRQAPLDTRIDSILTRIPAVTDGRGCAKTPILPLTQDMATVKRSINNLQAKGSTYIPAGISWGWRTLTPTAPFTETKKQDKDKTDNIMVIVTDGNNTRSKDGDTHHGEDRSAADKTMAKMCKNAKRDNIKIYTIALEIKDDTTLDLLQDCASDSDSFFDASNGDELGDAFSQIATSLTNTRITS